MIDRKKPGSSRAKDESNLKIGPSKVISRGKRLRQPRACACAAALADRSFSRVRTTRMSPYNIFAHARNSVCAALCSLAFSSLNFLFFFFISFFFFTRFYLTRQAHPKKCRTLNVVHIMCLQKKFPFPFSHAIGESRRFLKRRTYKRFGVRKRKKPRETGLCIVAVTSGPYRIVMI